MITPNVNQPTPFDSFPAEMKAIPQWVCWKKLPPPPGKSKHRKIPVDPKSGGNADTTDPAAWSSFDQAIDCFEKNHGLAGVGFVFTANDPYVGIDLDECRDPATGILEPWAKAALDKLNTYTEISPSGTGVHAIAKGLKPGSGAKSGHFEMYESKRFFTVTGQRIENYPSDAMHNQSGIEEIYNQHFETTLTQSISHNASNDGVFGLGLTDAELIERIEISHDAHRYKTLTAGDWRELGYPSQSEADLAACSILAKHGADAEQIDRIFRTTGLLRDKWDSARGDSTYGKWTIQKAMSSAISEAAREYVDSLNLEYAVVTVGNKVRVMCHKVSPNGLRQEFDLLSPTDFKTLLGNQPSPDEKKPLGSWWLLHPNRKGYLGIVFEPNQAANDYYNLWQGFGVVATPGSCQLFKQFMLEVICASNQAHFDYLWNWCAFMAQFPEKLPEVAIVLMGGQGTGKNTFVDTLGVLVGSHFLAVNRMEQVTGRFNSHLKDTLLLHANEAMWGGTKSDVGALKALITDKTIPVEFKGKDIINIGNHVHLVISSNEDWPVPIDADDRRFFVLKVSSLHQQDRDYFGQLNTELNNGGYEALLHEFLQTDLTSFDPRNKPKTAQGSLLKMRSADPVFRWWHECLQAGEIAFPQIYGGSVPEWPESKEKSDFFDAFREWCKTQRLAHPPVQSDFFKKLLKCMPSAKDFRPMVKGVHAGSRRRHIKLPDFRTCREEFEQAMNVGGHVDWEDQS